MDWTQFRRPDGGRPRLRRALLTATMGRTAHARPGMGATFLMGTQNLYDFADHNPDVFTAPADFVNDPFFVFRWTCPDARNELKAEYERRFHTIY